MVDNGKRAPDVRGVRSRRIAASFVIDTLPARGFTIVLPALPGLDTVIARVQRDGIDVHVGWDIWSGLFVYADSANGDALVVEIAGWLAPQLAKLGDHARELVDA